MVEGPLGEDILVGVIFKTDLRGVHSLKSMMSLMMVEQELRRHHKGVLYPGDRRPRKMFQRRERRNLIYSTLTTTLPPPRVRRTGRGNKLISTETTISMIFKVRVQQQLHQQTLFP